MSPDQPGNPARKLARLEKVSLPRLLFALLRNRFTGWLELRQPPPRDGERKVWMRGGMPVFTDWQVPDLVLGELLFEAGLLDRDTLESRLRTVAGGDGPLGHQLLEHGDLTATQRTEWLREQCNRKLERLFTLRTGEVYVVEGSHALGNNDELVPINVLALLRRGIFRHYAQDRIAEEMGAAFEQTFRTTPALERYKAHFGFDRQDLTIVGRLARGATIQQLEPVGTDEQHGAKLVYLLWTCQMAQAGSAKASSPSPPQSQKAPAEKEPPASVPSPDPPQQSTTSGSSQPRDFETELGEMEARIEDGAHAFALLGIPITAGKKDIRRAWADLSRKFHPDALQSKKLGHLRERVENVFASLSEAHMLLGDKQEREQLQKTIEAGDDPSRSRQDATAMARAAIESEIIAKEADKLLRAGKFARARERYLEASKLTPEEADLRVAIAWCDYQLSSKGQSEARMAVTEIDNVLENNPSLARAHYYRGMLLLGLGTDDLALAAFFRAHELDPQMIDAERQARAIRMRRKQASTTASPKGERRKFGIKGLFGKK